MNKFYVYEWIRLDTNEPFYVGKGHDNRCYELTRGTNSHFNNIVKSIPCVVNILHENLDEKTAFGLEVWYIREYRDVIGYNLVNITDGGEGCVIIGRIVSYETKCKIGNKLKGIPKSYEHKLKVSKSLKGKKHSKLHNQKVKENHADFSGKKNPNAKSIICINTKRIFFTIKDACKFYKCDEGGVRACCKGKKQTSGKFNGEKLKWKYIKWNHNKKYKII